MIYLKLLRIHTLLLSSSSVAMGVLLSLYDLSSFSAVSASRILLIFLTAFSLQIIVNIANDYGDGLRGVDKHHIEGQDRKAQWSKIPERTILLVLKLFIALAVLLGVSLIYTSFKQFSLTMLFWGVIGLFCIFAALKYSLGKNPHATSGLGDISVFIFFGLVAVLGSYFFVNNQLPPYNLLLESSAMGLLCVSVLNINNIRDLITDTQSGRKTVAIRLGEKKAKIYQQCLILSSFFLFLIASWLRVNTASQWLVFLLFLPLFWINFSLNVPKERYNNYLKTQCLIIFIFSFCYASSFFLIKL